MSSVKDKMKQKRISHFFNKKRPDPSEEETEGASTEEGAYDQIVACDIDEEDEDEDEGGITGKKDKYISPEDSSLPPISRLPDIFLDIISRLSEVKTLAEHIKGRKLRVATMCSGTESPLLALNLISRAMTEKFGITIDVEHVFSCEIVPFKQAYIERNFQPPLLFRDVCELGDDYAYVAWFCFPTEPSDYNIDTRPMAPKHSSPVTSTSSSPVHLASTTQISIMKRRTSIKAENLAGHFTACSVGSKNIDHQL
jgi:hypothetical protein